MLFFCLYESASFRWPRFLVAWLRSVSYLVALVRPRHRHRQRHNTDEWMNERANEWIMQISKHQVGYAHGESITFIFPRAHTQAHPWRRYRHWCSVSLSPSLSITHLIVVSFVRSFARSFVYFSIFILRSHNTHFTATSTKEKPPVNINYLGLVFVCCLYCELMALLSFTGFSAHTLRFPCFILLQIKEHILIRRSWSRKCVCVREREGFGMHGHSLLGR